MAKGLPLDEINKTKIVIDKKRKMVRLQQGLAEGNPDVDAIYRLTNKKINIKFKISKYLYQNQFHHLIVKILFGIKTYLN